MAKNTIWQEQKRLWCRLPFTFTKYILTDDRILIRSGFINSREDEVRLYRIKDISITRSLIQKIFGLGTIHIKSDDKTLNDFDLINITDSYNKKEQLSEMVEAERNKKHASIREFSGGGNDTDNADTDIDIDDEDTDDR